MVARKRSGRKAQQAQQPSVEAAVVEAASAQAPAQGLRPSLAEVLAAVASLHADQLKPSGRILRKRLAERASGLSMEEIYSAAPSAGLPSLPEIDVAHLRALCDACGDLRIEADEGGDWSAVLAGQPMDFVDVHSVEDSYPRELWAAAEDYFLGLEGPEMKLPGGRYACAQALLGRGLDFLEGRSLGQACHVVQLAISERKILGYCNGTVVPYSHSQSMLKERCAEQQQPIAQPGAAQAGEAAPAMPLATWEVARRLLREILEEALQPGQGPPVVPLSNVKRLFRSRYHTELSETMLGHSRMADLMQDERFQDLCTLRLQKGGYVVVGSSSISPSSKASPSGKTISLAETLQPQPRSSGDAVISLASGLRLEEVEAGKAGAASSTSAAAPPSSRARQSLQLAGGLQLDAGEPAAASPQPGHAQPLRLELCLGKPMRWGDIEDEPPLESGAPLPMSLPLESTRLPLATPLPSPGVAADDTVARWMREPKRLSFCADEPLRLEDAASPLASESAGLARQSLPTPLPSPGEPASATVRRWATAPRRAEFFPAPAAGAAAAGGDLQLPLAMREETSSTSSADPSPLERERTPKPSAWGSFGKWCPDEPLVLEDAGSALLAMPTPLASPGDPGSATRRRWAGVPGGAPRRLEFFPEHLEAVPQPGSPCLLGRTSPDRKPKGSLKLSSGMEGSPGLCDGVRLLETLPSPQRKTQALRAGAAGRGWLPLARELCAGDAQGCPSSFVQNTFIHAKLPPPTPLGAAVRSQSLPKDLGSRRDDSSSPASQRSGGHSEATRESTRSTPSQQAATPLALELPIQRRRSGEALGQRGRFCMDEPLCLEDAGVALEVGESLKGCSSALEDMPRWLAPSPRDSSLALVVRNTFLHSAPPPPTPAACTVRRSRSLPPAGAQRGGSPQVFLRTFMAPQALEGEAAGKGSRGASVAEALPEFVPISPALVATTPESSGWPATPLLAPCAAQRVVRLADHI